MNKAHTPLFSTVYFIGPVSLSFLSTIGVEFDEMDLIVLYGAVGCTGYDLFLFLPRAVILTVLLSALIPSLSNNVSEWMSIIV